MLLSAGLSLGIAEVVLRVLMCREAGVSDFALVRERYLGNRLAIFPEEKMMRGSGMVPNSRIDSGTTINSFGFRGAEVAQHKPSGFIRIVCLGGSSTFCTGVTSNFAAWPASLQAIATRNGSHVEVLNGGVPSFTSGESIDRFQSLFLPLQPDIAVLYNEHNDVLYRRLYRLSYDPRQDVPVPITSSLERVLSHSAVYLRVRAFVTFRAKSEKMAKSVAATDAGQGSPTPDLPVTNWVGKEGQQASALAEEATKQSNPYFAAKDLDDYKNRLRRFVAVCRENHVTPVLATEVLSFSLDAGEAVYLKKGSPILTSYFPRYDWFREMYGAFNEAIREVARAEGILVFDADRLLVRSDAFFGDHVHLSDQGCHELASLLEKTLRDAKLLDAPAH